jgi:outer membrane protein OmpA-like peptidoglycan-associated protein
MIKKHITLAILPILFILLSTNVFGQTPKDTNNAQIKQQAVQMREKINNYLSDKLAEEKKAYGNGLHSDSLLNVINNQNNEINLLNSKLKFLEEKINYIDGYNKLTAEQSNGPFVNPSTGQNYIQYANKQLNVFFSFNDFTLTDKQTEAIENFLSSKNIKHIKIVSYTDWRGKSKVNTLIAKKRAQAVTKLLKNKTYSVLVNTQCSPNMTNEGLNSQWCRRIEIILN